MKKYDYLVVGSGLYGAVFAHEVRKAGKSVLVIDKRPNIAGNVYTEEIEKRDNKRAGESGRTGNFPGWKRHLRKADQGIYGEAVGT